MLGEYFVEKFASGFIRKENRWLPMQCNNMLKIVVSQDAVSIQGMRFFGWLISYTLLREDIVSCTRDEGFFNTTYKIIVVQRNNRLYIDLFFRKAKQFEEAMEKVGISIQDVDDKK